MPGPEREVTAVRSALYRGDRAAALALVDAGAELNVFDLAALGDTAGLRRIIDSDPRAVHAISADGFTALHFAAFLGGAGAVEVLLAAGADPNSVADNDMRVQPLHSAAALGDVEACRLLISSGADPNARQVGEHTPLHEAAITGNAALVELLLVSGADPARRTPTDGMQSHSPRRTFTGRSRRASGLREIVRGPNGSVALPHVERRDACRPRALVGGARAGPRGPLARAGGG